MPNLNLTYSGNMNITSASIEGNQLKVSYEPNNTGAVSGFSFTPPVGSEFVCGETYTITATPKFRGTVLTENFTVSGVDMAGVQRSDTSTLKQPYDTNLTHYELNLASVGATIISSSVTSDYLELEISIDNDEYAEIDIQPGQGGVIVYPIDNITDGSGPDTGDTGTVASSLTLVVADSITGSGIASAVWSPSGATVSLRYQSNSPAYATIDPVTGEITVLQTGDVRFTVFDDITGLFDSKVVHCYKEGEGPDTGDTGTVINFLAINVPAYIWNTGYVGAQYSPDYAEVDLHYTSNLPAVASVNEQTGQVTVYQTGNVTFCVTDTRSGLSDCMPVNVGIIEPDTGVSATAITINVPDTITDSGLATTTVSPETANVNLYYTYEDTDIIGANRASIDRYTGQINVRSTGTARFCVEDRYTGLKDCKVVNVVKTPEPGPDTGGTGGTLSLYYALYNKNVVSDCKIVKTACNSGYFWSWYSRMWSDFITGYTESGREVIISADQGTCDLYKTDDVDGDGFVRIDFPGVRFIPANAFYGGEVGACGDGRPWRLVGFEIGEGIEEIGESAFADWGAQHRFDIDLVIPASVTKIESMGFDNTYFNSITIEGSFYQPNGVNPKVPYNAISSCPVYVPESEVQTYKTWYLAHHSSQPSWVECLGAEPVYITALTLNVNYIVEDGDYAEVEYEPSSATTTNIQYSSSNPSVVSINQNGVMSVNENGSVNICATDTYTNISDCKTVVGHKTGPDTGDPYYSQYLTFEVLTRGQITVSRTSGSVKLSFSKDSGTTWTTTSAYTVNAGDVVFAKGSISGNNAKISTTCQFNLSGNILSLVYGDNFNNYTTGGILPSLFFQNTNLLNAENLVFPEVNSGDYASMFQGCTNLVKAPKSLQATVLRTTDTYGCYTNMFMNCTSLTTAPALPATTMARQCYYGMFYGCTSLTTAPELPAMTLASECYYAMFARCTSLTNVPSILPATSLENGCYESMFGSCTSLTTAPELPAATLANSCYRGMFGGCTNLYSIKCLATDISATNCTLNWVRNVAASGVFTKASAVTNWTTGDSGIPSGWTVQNAS